ncbi:HAD family hydrolase [Aquabacterium sp.]|uniref:HAD family hydrolase n=1 Tax=Aquabacterium sp. TaxID=1872578 RepID=UPI002B605A78|nr:HAD family hydrolase [Aquabacterium sp.]HSW03888.1 HAD family hydrolase [Aquabacterium sp.]
MKLALFDLDHTLIPFDSGMAWTEFLVSAGVLPDSAAERYLDFCHQYVAGTLDIHAMHRASVAPLACFPRPLLDQWGREFELRVAPRLPAAMRALVQQHQDAGDLCAIVTATTRFIAEPIARLFGVDQVVATEPATADGSPQGALTGEIAGLPCYREHKVTRVAGWLAERRPPPAGGLSAFERSWFYSDSASDLPLLLAVTDPVAVRPDERLRAHAVRERWPVID